MSLQRFLEETSKRHSVPAMAAATYRGGDYQFAVCGKRKHGHPEQVSVNDLWHIGSCTKSMTAVVAASLIESGRLQWTTTVGQALPKWCDDGHKDWRDVTLEQLLSHRAGAPHEVSEKIWMKALARNGNPRQQRESFVRDLLADAPLSQPGTTYLYSNQGYSIAGAMMEEVEDCSWENLIYLKLFQPLAMHSAGFGAPGATGVIAQPRGHQDDLKPVEPGVEADNPAAIGPGGIVHCSITDLAHYAALHADDEHPHRNLISAESWQKLHAPYPDDASEYAMGLNVFEREWGGGRVWMHAGSNTMWFAVMWMAPKKRAAYVIAANRAGDAGALACDEVAAYLVTRD